MTLLETCVFAVGVVTIFLFVILATFWVWDQILQRKEARAPWWQDPKKRRDDREDSQ